MKLTGQAKGDFERWLVNNVVGALYTLDMKTPILYLSSNHHFNQLPNPMKFGVYVDFFDSVGIEITIGGHTITTPALKWLYQVRTGSGDCCEFGQISRAKARTAAIKKANEIFNTKPMEDNPKLLNKIIRWYKLRNHKCTFDHSKPHKEPRPYLPAMTYYYCTNKDCGRRGYERSII